MFHEPNNKKVSNHVPRNKKKHIESCVYFIKAILGPRRMEERVSHHVNISLRKLVNLSICQHVKVSLVLVTIFYVVVFLCGVVGNLLVCVVIARSKCLHSAMNYYLISLALADLILLILGKASNIVSIPSTKRHTITQAVDFRVPKSP